MAVVIKSYQKDGNTKVTEHFTYGEFRSYSSTYNKLFTDEIKLDTDLPNLLEKLRKYKNLSRITIINGYRCPEHNKKVGGGSASQHLYGKAADICCYKADGSVMSAKEVCCALEDLGAYGIGYMRSDHVHVDVRPKSSKWYGDETVKLNGKYLNIGESFYKYWKIKKGSYQTNSLDSSPISSNNKEEDEMVDTMKMKIDGKELTVNRINKNGINYVELKSFTQAGYNVGYNGVPEIAMPSGNVKFSHNGKTFDVDGINNNGTNLVGARTLLESLGFVVEWDQETQTVIIK